MPAIEGYTLHHFCYWNGVYRGHDNWWIPAATNQSCLQLQSPAQGGPLYKGQAIPNHPAIHAVDLYNDPLRARTGIAYHRTGTPGMVRMRRSLPQWQVISDRPLPYWADPLLAPLLEPAAPPAAPPYGAIPGREPQRDRVERTARGYYAPGQRPEIPAWLRPRLKPYQRPLVTPSREISVGAAQGVRERVLPGAAHNRLKPERRTREHKLSRGRWWRVVSLVLGHVGEAGDFIDAVYFALPRHERLPGFAAPWQKVAAIFAADEINYTRLVFNLIFNQVTDMSAGRWGQGMQMWAKENGALFSPQTGEALRQRGAGDPSLGLTPNITAALDRLDALIADFVGVDSVGATPWAS